MIELPLEITQGDPFYYELAFVDAYNQPVDLTGWALKVDFKASFSDAAPLFSLTLDDAGIALLPSTGVVALQFDGSSLDAIDINPVPRNGEIVPSQTIFGDVKLTPPAGTTLVQGSGSRTVIPLKVYLGVTA